MQYFKSAAALTTVALLAGCSGGNGSSVAPIASHSGGLTTAGKSTTVSVTLRVPQLSKRQTSGVRKREYVSPNTLGLIVQVKTVNADGSLSLYSDTGYNLMTAPSNQSSCTANPNGNGALCTIALNAPDTSNTKLAFFIYAYDNVQTAGAIAESYQPAGKLLSEDVGAMALGDRVPGTSTNKAGIVADQSNSLVFTLNPIVGGIATTVDPAQTGTVLSVSGSGGTSNSVAVDGLDPDNNQIDFYLNGSNDDQYENPIQVKTSAGSYQPSVIRLNSALTDTVTTKYTPASGDQPQANTDTPGFGTLDLSTIENPTDGFNGTTDVAALSNSSVVIAPLYALQSSTSAQNGASVEVDAMQYAIPTLENQAYTIQPASSCSTFTVTQITGPAPTYVQARWNITPASQSASGSCQYTISDGYSTVTTRTISTNATTGQVTVP